LTEADVLKLLPIGYWLAPTAADSENDWIIICAETTEFVIEFTDGKLSSRSATFHPAAKSKNLTLERFRELKDGMTKEEVEKLFGEELHRARSVPTENRTQQVDRWRYVRGREMEIYIARGKVAGALLKAYIDNSGNPERQDHSFVTLRNLVANYDGQHPLVCGAGRDFPAGREVVFRSSESGKPVHAVFPGGATAPENVDGSFVLHGRYQGIQNRDRPKHKLYKRIPSDYRYFVVASWERRR